jgi:hypothetical protein
MEHEGAERVGSFFIPDKRVHSLILTGSFFRVVTFVESTQGQIRAACISNVLESSCHGQNHPA